MLLGSQIVQFLAIVGRIFFETNMDTIPGPTIHTAEPFLKLALTAS